MNSNPISFIKELVLKPGKDIWLVGGAKLNASLLNANLIDEYLIFVLPIIIGDGISLFDQVSKHSFLNLKSTKSYSSNGIMLHYTKR